MPDPVAADVAPFEGSPDCEITVTYEDGFMCVRAIDAAGCVYGGKLGPEASDRDRDDVLYSAMVFVHEQMRAVPVVVGYESEWLTARRRRFERKAAA